MTNIQNTRTFICICSLSITIFIALFDCNAWAADLDSLGYSKRFPIKVGSAINGGPMNQRIYLRQLVDTKGRELKFRRAGSCCSYASDDSPMGMAMLDIYQVYFFSKGSPVDSAILFLTFYEYEKPTVAPKGFTFKTSHPADSLEANEYNLVKRYGTAKKLSLSFEKFKQIPPYVFDLSNLEELSVAYCKNLTEIPLNIDKLRKLRILELQGTGIRHFPKEMGELDSLEEVHLNGEMDWDNVFDVLSKCKNLKIIGWWDAGLKVIPISIAKCQSIQVIDLKNDYDLNYAQEFITLSTLKNLREITISINSDKMPQGIDLIQSLKVLIVDNCDVRELSGDIASLKNLEQLHLRSCRKILHFPVQFKDCRKLQKVSLYAMNENFDFEGGLKLFSKCDLKYLELGQNWRLKKLPAAAFRYKGLEYLGLNIYETDSIPREIGNLTKLKEIVLGPTNFKCLPEEFGKLKSLKTIDLSGQVDFDFKQVFEVLAKLDSLEEINLNWGGQKIPDSVVKLKRLKKIVVSNYPITKSELERLKRLVPQCEFVF